MENMEKYHIGHEIEKEMRAKGMTARELAWEINLSPQAVYDIFKKNYIATDRLAMVQRVLGRDFFKELSEALKNGGILDKKEDESVVRERFEMLMPEDKLRVIDRERFYQLAEEFVNTEHHKPLVIFYNDWRQVQTDLVELYADRDLRPGQVKYIDLKDLRKKGKSDDEIIRDYKVMPQPIVQVNCGNYDESFLFMKRLADETGKKVYAYCSEENALKDDYNSGIKYWDRAIETFGAWREQIHFAYLDDERQSYRRNRQLYLAYKWKDIIRFVWRKLSVLPSLRLGEDPNHALVWNWLNNPNILMEDYRNWIEEVAEKNCQLSVYSLMYMDDEVIIKKEDDSRWRIILPACENYEWYVSNMVPERLKKAYALTSLWIEADENGVYDYEGSIMQNCLERSGQDTKTEA